MIIKSRILSAPNFKHKFPLFLIQYIFIENMIINKLLTVNTEHFHGSNCHVSKASKRETSDIYNGGFLKQV